MDIILEDYQTYLFGALGLAALVLGFLGAPLFLWTVVAGLTLFAVEAEPAGWIAFVVVAGLFNLAFLRRFLVTRPVMVLMKWAKLVPQISKTELVALKAGNVWAEAELFSGKPNYKKLLGEPIHDLTPEERAFIDGPTNELCRMADDWKIWHERRMPEEVWEFARTKGFLGMIIPKEYGGMGFSALAHSEVVARLSSRSIPLGITVMVPNSLGPAELLIHYGTDAQKKHYLPRLANGADIPCFALTEPGAGSDAASIQSSGEVFRGEDGKLYLRLNWDKRWITLAAVSTVIGLAFKLKDPENLLGKGTDPGITCGLVPASTPGVVLGRRHDPLHVPFFNCPTKGKDVVVSIDAIIGGPEQAGQGWKMLMESLAAGRGISLPAQCSASGKYVTRIASAFAVVRKQFGLSIGKFEGIHEPLARIGGSCYLLEAGRRYTLGAIDQGIKPPVVTAIAKYNFTEIQRDIINDGMDILGGAGITRGPRNLLAHAYFAAPISITVEGANILTRTLIIFGQGALRAHPYAFQEVGALAAWDVPAFDRAFWGHVGHVIRNTFRAVLLSLTRGHLVPAPVGGGVSRYYRKLSWASASFALLADVAMGALGGKLKVKEKITGRFADILSWMYLGFAVLRRYEVEGRRKEDLPFVQWSMEFAFRQIQNAFDGLYANFQVPLIGWIFRGPVSWWSRLNSLSSPVSDRIENRIAELVQTPGAQRDRLTDGIYLPTDQKEALARLEHAMHLTVESEKVASKVRKAVRSKKIKKKKNRTELFEDAREAQVITQGEFDLLSKAEEARREAVAVDDFSLNEYWGIAEEDSGALARRLPPGASVTPMASRAGRDS